MARSALAKILTYREKDLIDISEGIKVTKN
jgi:hypothetical protein